MESQPLVHSNGSKIIDGIIASRGTYSEAGINMYVDVVEAMIRGDRESSFSRKYCEMIRDYKISKRLDNRLFEAYQLADLTFINAFKDACEVRCMLKMGNEAFPLTNQKNLEQYVQAVEKLNLLLEKNPSEYMIISEGMWFGQQFGVTGQLVWPGVYHGRSLLVDPVLITPEVVSAIPELGEQVVFNEDIQEEVIMLTKEHVLDDVPILCFIEESQNVEGDGYEYCIRHLEYDKLRTYYEGNQSNDLIEGEGPVKIRMQYEVLVDTGKNKSVTVLRKHFREDGGEYWETETLELSRSRYLMITNYVSGSQMFDCQGETYVKVRPPLLWTIFVKSLVRIKTSRCRVIGIYRSDRFMLYKSVEEWYAYYQLFGRRFFKYVSRLKGGYCPRRYFRKLKILMDYKELGDRLATVKGTIFELMDSAGLIMEDWEFRGGKKLEGALVAEPCVQFMINCGFPLRIT
jgi:hypothetical protein